MLGRKLRLKSLLFYDAPALQIFEAGAYIRTGDRQCFNDFIRIERFGRNKAAHSSAYPDILI